MSFGRIRSVALRAENSPRGRTAEPCGGRPGGYPRPAWAARQKGSNPPRAPAPAGAGLEEGAGGVFNFGEAVAAVLFEEGVERTTPIAKPRL
jgi:hypothetical protein